MLKILVVDDDLIARSMLYEGLALSGFTDVELMESGIGALSFLENDDNQVDCFLLDIQMPEIDGINLCQKIRSIPKYLETPIIMVTAMHEKMFVEAAFLAGATDYITKPFDILELTTRVGIAKKLSNQMKTLAENAGDVANLKRQIRLLDPSASELPFAVQADGFTDFPLFEQFLLRLPKTELLKTCITCISVMDFTEITTKISRADIQLVVAEIAKIVSDHLFDEGCVFSYSGNGAFICATNTTDAQYGFNENKKQIIQENLNRMTMNNSGSPKLFLTLEFGETVNYNQFSADDPLKLVQSELDSFASHIAISLSGDVKNHPNTKGKIQKEFENRLKSVVPGYLATLNEFMAQLEILLEKIIKRDAGLSEIQSAGNIAHKIAGVAPALGFGHLGELGALVEHDTSSILNSNASPPLLGHLEQSVGKLLDEIEDTIVENISLPKIDATTDSRVSQF